MRDIDHFIALAGAMLLVAMQHKEKPWLARVAISGASGGIGFSVAPEVASATQWLGEMGAMVMITALVYGSLDTLLALIADREAIKTLALRRNRQRGDGDE